MSRPRAGEPHILDDGVGVDLGTLVAGLGVAGMLVGAICLHRRDVVGA